MFLIEQAVGPKTARWRGKPCMNTVDDKKDLIEILGRIERADGGQRGWAEPDAGAKGDVPPELAAAIGNFERHWAPKAKLGILDGAVRPDSALFRKMWSLAFEETAADVFTSDGIEFRIKDQVRKEFKMPVIAPISAGGMLFEITVTAEIHRFVMQMTKDEHVYWLGVSVPKNCWNFDALHVFFHPTVINSGQVVALDSDYRSFGGGWVANMRRYIAIEGVQAAAAKGQPLIVPFTTMAAGAGLAPDYMFATRPVETLNAIASAIAWHDDPLGEREVKLKRLGTASFSNGIGAHQTFIKSLASSGLIVESIDLDSGFMNLSPRLITKAPGGAGRAFSQNPPFHPQPGWLHIGANKFTKLGTFKGSVHGQIGWMGYYLMLLSSVL